MNNKNKNKINLLIKHRTWCILLIETKIKNKYMEVEGMQ